MRRYLVTLRLLPPTLPRQRRLTVQELPLDDAAREPGMETRKADTVLWRVQASVPGRIAETGHHQARSGSPERRGRAVWDQVTRGMAAQEAVRAVEPVT